MRFDRHPVYLWVEKAINEALGRTFAFFHHRITRTRSKKMGRFRRAGRFLPTRRFVDRNNSIIHRVSSTSTPFPNSMSVRAVGLLTRNRLQKFNDRCVREEMRGRLRYPFVPANRAFQFVKSTNSRLKEPLELNTKENFISLIQELH